MSPQIRPNNPHNLPDLPNANNPQRSTNCHKILTKTAQSLGKVGLSIVFGAGIAITTSTISRGFWKKGLEQASALALITAVAILTRSIFRKCNNIQAPSLPPHAAPPTLPAFPPHSHNASGQSHNSPPHSPTLTNTSVEALAPEQPPQNSSNHTPPQSLPHAAPPALPAFPPHSHNASGQSHNSLIQLPILTQDSVKELPQAYPRDPLAATEQQDPLETGSNASSNLYLELYEAQPLPPARPGIPTIPGIEALELNTMFEEMINSLLEDTGTEPSVLSAFVQQHTGKLSVELLKEAFDTLKLRAPVEAFTVILEIQKLSVNDPQALDQIDKCLFGLGEQFIETPLLAQQCANAIKDKHLQQDLMKKIETKKVADENF